MDSASVLMDGVGITVKVMLQIATTLVQTVQDLTRINVPIV